MRSPRVCAAFPLCTAMLVSYGIISEIQYVFLKKKHNLINSLLRTRDQTVFQRDSFAKLNLAPRVRKKKKILQLYLT